jgi:predicted enzyme related to lactoylglutathione lyase
MSEARQVDVPPATWPGGIAAITLFVEDLAEAKRFYEDVFGLPVFFEDDNSAVFKFGETLVNLLETREAPALVAPAEVAPPDGGVRFQFTLAVDDVDAMAEEVKRRGVELLKGRWIVRGASAPRASATPAATSGRSPASARRAERRRGIDRLRGRVRRGRRRGRPARARRPS